MSPGSTAERIVLTGATGFLGTQILRVLLERRPDASLILLIRESPEKSLSERLDILLMQCCDETTRESARRRVEAVAADVSAERCGLSERDWQAVARGATRVIHGAASVRFDMTLAEARAVNAEGARNLMLLAAEANRGGVLRSFTYVSTAFVAGRRKGLVREDELDAGQRFRNTYERSKCESESLIRAGSGELPVTVLRPSIIVGHSRSGATTSLNAMYRMLEAYAKRRWRFVPACPESHVDAVPVDFVAEAAVRLAFHPEAAGRAFHLCAGPQRSATIGEIARAAARAFGAPPPRFVPPAILTPLGPLLLGTAWGARRRLIHRIRHYRPYLEMGMQFDTSQADALLAPAEIEPPRVMDQIERLLAFCLETDWGRRPSAAVAAS